MLIAGFHVSYYLFMPDSRLCVYRSNSEARADATGAGIGGFLGGTLLATAAFLLLRWHKAHRKPRDPAINPFGYGDKVAPSIEYSPAYPPLHPAQDSNLPNDGTGSFLASLSTQIPAPTLSQVYVVHHDGGEVPPVTVIASGGTEVVELPPGYIDLSVSGTASESPGSDPVIELTPNRRK